MTHRPVNTTGLEPTPRVSPDDRVLWRIAWLLLFVALTLGVASALHLSGVVHGSPPFDADHAGIAEAVIGAVLVGSALVMLGAPAHARAAGLAGTGFAVVGFAVGLDFTSQGGHVPDVAYHVTLLPVLLATLLVLLRLTLRPRRNPPRPMRAAGVG